MVRAPFGTVFEARPPQPQNPVACCTLPSTLSFTPLRSRAVFAPVWTTLYALIGFSCARTMGPALGAAPPRALLAWQVQSVLNLLWAPTFFGSHRLRLGFLVSSALLAAAAWMAMEFAAVAGALSAALLLPYLAWLSFATALNLRLWQLNGPGA